ncbi:hypothetical protein MMC28_009388 [Mycoblastus sanguinarius]|nr:hypothetical protein [Mycoblastus sanguinarius]
MSGFEAVSSAAGLISLSLTLFKGCVQAFQFLETAAHLGSDADMVRCKLEWEQYRLYQWAEQVGLEERPKQGLNWSLIANILKQLEALLTSSQKLKEKYHLDVVELEKNALVRESPAAARGGKSGFGLLLLRLKPAFPLASSRIIQENNTPIKKLQWAAVGKDNLRRLVDDIGYFNSCLHNLLESTDRDFVASALGALLRDIISRSNVSSELDVVKEILQSTLVTSHEAVASAASLKNIRLILGLGKTTHVPSRQQSKLTLKHLKPAYFERDNPFIPPLGRELARYKADSVLVEWRLIEKKLEPELKSRVHQLAILLGKAGDPSFHTLDCIGILPKNKAYEPHDDAYVCYGLVFGLRTLEAPNLAAPRILTLLDLYKKSRKPSLNKRLAIALAVAETVLQLHTTGWLHKGLRSDNILFIEAGVSRWNSDSAGGPYLAGYDFARPSNAETEMIPGRPDHDIYRHPLAQGAVRSNFNRSFDLYALGCVLLEIALWSSLQDILSQASTPTDSAHMDEKRSADQNAPDWFQINTVKANILQNDQKDGDLANVSFYAGDTFKEVILLCLHAANEDPDDEDLEIQKLIVDKLKECRF